MQREEPAGVRRAVERANWLEQQLTRGQKYRITRPFRDLDNDKHQCGEEWYFVGGSGSTYDGVMHIFVLDDDGIEWRITFDIRDSTAVDIRKYVTAIPGQFRADLFATSRCIECLQPLDVERPGYCPNCHLVWNPAQSATVTLTGDSRVNVALIALWFVIVWAVICLVPWHEAKPDSPLLPLGTPYVNEQMWGHRTLVLLLAHCTVSALIAIAIDAARLAWKKWRAG